MVGRVFVMMVPSMAVSKLATAREKSKTQNRQVCLTAAGASEPFAAGLRVVLSDEDLPVVGAGVPVCSPDVAWAPGARTGTAAAPSVNADSFPMVSGNRYCGLLRSSRGFGCSLMVSCARYEPFLRTWMDLRIMSYAGQAIRPR